jgi:hypothetical protein
VTSLGRTREVAHFVIFDKSPRDFESGSIGKN